MSYTTKGQIARPDALASYTQKSSNRAGIPPGLKLGEDFPLVCEKCLGDNPFIRMIKMPNDAPCKLTNRPYNNFKWRPSKGEPYRTTQCCYEIAVEKNICQSCLVDMEYGLPVALKDTFLAHARTSMGDGVISTPKSEANQAYYFNQILAKRGQVSAMDRRTDPSAKLLQTVRAYNSEGQQSFNKEEAIRNKKRKLYEPPKDSSITTLFLSKLPQEAQADDIRHVMSAFGPLTNIHMLKNKNSAFVEYSSRQEAERAATTLKGRVVLKGNKVRVGWALRAGTNAQKKPRLDDETPTATPTHTPAKSDTSSAHFMQAPTNAASQATTAQALPPIMSQQPTGAVQQVKLPPPPAKLAQFIQTMLPPPNTFRADTYVAQPFYPSLTREALEGIEVVEPK